MYKITLLLLFSFSCTCLKAQTNLDSLYTIWQDDTQIDSLRTTAYVRFIWGGFLFSAPDSAFILAEELINFAKKKQYPFAEAAAYHIQAAAYGTKGDYQQALHLASSYPFYYFYTLAHRGSPDRIVSVFKKARRAGSYRGRQHKY